MPSWADGEADGYWTASNRPGARYVQQTATVTRVVPPGLLRWPRTPPCSASAAVYPDPLRRRRRALAWLPWSSGPAEGTARSELTRPPAPAPVRAHLSLP